MALVATPALANSRGPVINPYFPSSAPHVVSREVRVLREDLAFECGDRDCRVTAKYHVQASRALSDVELEFLLPPVRP